jgi:hypothetical protein
MNPDLANLQIQVNRLLQESEAMRHVLLRLSPAAFAGIDWEEINYYFNHTPVAMPRALEVIEEIHRAVENRG